MKANRFTADPGRRQRFPQFRREVQPCRRRGDRLRILTRKTRLIGLAVLRIRRTPPGDIGRQRHGAMCVECLVKLPPRQIEDKRDFTRLGLACQLRLKALPEGNPVSRFQALSRPGQRPPGRAINPLDQIGIDGHVRAGVIACRPHAFQRGGNDPRIIEDQRVPGLEIVRQVADMRILQSAIAIHDKQPRGILRLNRPQRDQLFRQVEGKR